MRMKKQMDDPPRPFRHSARIGQGGKSGPKRAVNVTIDAEILATAKRQGINLSAALEGELRRLTQQERIKHFQEETREAAESYNRFIEEHGIWSEKYRAWGKTR
jgi:antitoxin CcdA